MIISTAGSDVLDLDDISLDFTSVVYCIDDEGNELGVLFDVLQTGANDVFVVKLNESDKELLLPNIPDCILDVDLENGVVKAHVLDGLMDL